MSTRPHSRRIAPSRPGWLPLALLLGLTGCSGGGSEQRDGSTSREDSGRAEARTTDTLAETSARSEARPPDAAAPACSPTLDLAPLTLDPAFCVGLRVTLAAAPTALAFRAGTLWTLTAGGTPFTLEIQEAPLGVAGGGPATRYFAAAPASTAKVFGGEYLALTGGGEAAAVGWSEQGTTAGSIYWGARGTAAPEQLQQATGNYDALFLDDQTLLVNGTGLQAAQDGQGVYVLRKGSAARRLIKDLGEFSGHLGLGTSVLFAGGYFKDGNKVYAFTLSELQAALASGKVLSATSDGDLVIAAEAIDATAVEDELVLARMNPTTYAFDGVTRVPVSVTGDAVKAGAPEPLVGAAKGASVVKLASWQGQLGLLLGDAKAELALVRRRP